MANKTELIRQALNAAESSIKLAKQLMSEVERGGNSGRPNQPYQRNENDNIPGLVGVFDGENMTTSTGQKLPVPANYAAKSQLVVGDTLKMIDQNGDKRFKQIQRVKRLRSTGIITKKEGKLTIVTQEGRYRVLPVAVEHLGLNVGDEVTVLVPESNLNATWAALEGSPAQKETKTEKKPVLLPEVKSSPTVAKEENTEKTKKEEPAETPVETTEVITPPPVAALEDDEEDVSEAISPIGEDTTPAAAVEEVEKVKEKRLNKEDDQPIKSQEGESVILTDEDLR